MRSFVYRMSLTPILAMLIVFFVAGCQAVKTNNPSVLLVEAGLPIAPQAQSAGSYQKDMKRWQSVLLQTADSQKKAEAHLHLAGLYLTKNNPQKDYHLGYQELTKATTAYPDLLSNMALVSWLEILSQLEIANQQALKKRASLEKELAQAHQQIGAQQQELTKLRQTLDKLKRLELSVERKRRTFK